MEPINLNEYQRLYIQAIYDYFQEHGKWPTHRHLERQFLRTHPDQDIEELAQSFPAGLTNQVDSLDTESKAILTVPAIYQFWGSAQELSTFVLVIETYVENYYSSEGEIRSLSSTDLARDNPTWRDNAIRKVGLLLLGEFRIWSSFTGPDNDGGWLCVIAAKDIRRFREVKTIEQYLEKTNIPKKLTSQPIIPNIEVPIVAPANDIQPHPDILAKCWDLYTAGKYDDAIHNATKALEVAVRKKAHLPHDRVGADLMSKAFNPNEPILRYSEVKAEQEGMMSLLRGVIQVFKNPQSHRFVGIQNQSECLGVLLMCSNLLYVVDNTEFVEKDATHAQP